MSDGSHSASDTSNTSAGDSEPSGGSDSQHLPASADDSTSPSHYRTDRRQITREELPDGVDGLDEVINTEFEMDCWTPDDREDVLCGVKRGLGLRALLYTWEFNLNQNNNWVVTERVHKSTLVARLEWIQHHGSAYLALLVPLAMFNAEMSPSIVERSLSTFVSVGLIPFVLIIGAKLIAAGIVYFSQVDTWTLAALEYGQRISINTDPRGRLRTAYFLSLILLLIWTVITDIYNPFFGELILPAAVDVLMMSLIIAGPIPLISQVVDVYYDPIPLFSAAVEKITRVVSNSNKVDSEISKNYSWTVIICFVPSIINLYPLLLLFKADISPSVSGFACVIISPIFSVLSVIYIRSLSGAEPTLWERNCNIRETSSRRQFFLLVVSVVVCYIGTYAFAWGINYLGIVIASLEEFQFSAQSLYFLVGVSLGLLPPLYVYAGIFYQITQTVTDTSQKWRSVRTGERLSQKDPKWNNDRIHSPVIVHGSRFDPKNAEAVQLFGTDYILITRSLYYNLQSDPDRLAAIFSHEQNHIEHNDTLLSSVVPIVAPVFLLSEAAIYAMCDYKSREYRADLGAIDQDDISHEDLRSALNRVSSDDGADNGPLPRGVAATPVKFSDAGSRWKPLFQYFFTPYSVAVHPSLKNRKRTIDPNMERPPEAKGIQPE